MTVAVTARPTATHSAVLIESTNARPAKKPDSTTCGTPARPTGCHSRRSAQLISVDHTSHNIQLDRPEIVLEKIKQLLR
ncbi:MAG TPA: hypothetical protein VHI95_05655 [Acidimicrobiales bacterium]|jgi:hypothetical protein|nr:hypothetical protein [Acidimicrobiales bacterium]